MFYPFPSYEYSIMWGDGMSEIKRNEIIYEEGWREASPIMEDNIPLDEAAASTVQPQEDQEKSRPLLITIQLALSLLAALVLFLLKAMDSEGYYNFMDYYHEELQKPVVSQEIFHAADALFEQNPVTMQATPDETAHSED